MWQCGSVDGLAAQLNCSSCCGALPPVPPLRHEDAPLTFGKIVCGAKNDEEREGMEGGIIWGTLCSIEGRFMTTNFQYLSSIETGNK